MVFKGYVINVHLWYQGITPLISPKTIACVGIVIMIIN
jgi:hypothetical protein